MIEVCHIANAWGEFQLRDVSLRVEDGEYFVILGPCGSGKTLLLEVIAGLHWPAAGQVLIDGRNVTALPPEQRRVGLVYQQHALFPHLSIRSNIGYGLRYLGMAWRAQQQRIDEMIELMDIAHLGGRERPAGLSGGEAQKVALARALAIEPRVLLLDEPLSSLDQRARDRVSGILEDIGPHLGIPVIHVTHDYHEAASLGDRIAVLRHGTVAQIGTVHDMFWHPQTRPVAEFLGTANILEARVEPIPDNLATAVIGDLTLKVPHTALCGEVALCVRPEEIEVTIERPHNGLNVLAGSVVELADRGFAVQLRLACGPTVFTAVMSRREFAARPLGLGAGVYLRMAPDALHVMAREQGAPADAD